MTGVENYLNEVICLQLKKPKNWNWQISTSKSSPHIALPTIQLYNSKGKLLGKLMWFYSTILSRLIDFNI